MASTTSKPTSKQHAPMAGPMAAQSSPLSAPSSLSAATPLPIISRAVPFQPQWRAAAAVPARSQRSTGTQSAVNTARGSPFSPVQSPSQSGGRVWRGGRVASSRAGRRTALPWTCRVKQTAPGSPAPSQRSVQMPRTRFCTSSRSHLSSRSAE